MKIVRRILIGLVLVTVLVPIAVFLVVVNFFSPEIKPMIVKLLNESTGGVVAIHGDLYAELGFTPTIGLRGLSLRNPQWNQNATLLTAEHASISFSLLPLFSRELVVNSIALDRAQLSLEQQGMKKNWVMSSSQTPALAVEEGTKNTSSFRSMPLNIGMVSVRDLTVNYKKDEVVQHILIEQAKLILADKPTLSTTLVYQNILHGRINAHLHHPIATIKDVASWMQPATIEVDVEAGKNHATLHGEMTWKDEKPQFRGAIEAKIPSAYQLASLWGGDAHSTIKPLNATTNMLLTPTMVSLEELHMDYGSYKVDATMHMDYQGKKPILGGVVHMPRVTLERSVHQQADDPSSPTSDASKEVIHKKAKDDTIPFALLNHVIVRDFQVQIDEILYGKDIVAKNVALPMALDNKTLAMRDAHAMVFDGMMRANLTVDARAMPATIAVSSTMDGMTLEQLARHMAKHDGVKKGAVAFDGTFTSKVTHYSDFIPNLDGTLHYHVGAMQWVLSELTSDAAVLFQAVRGKNVEAKTVDMTCALGVWNIRHGKAKAELAVMDGTAGLIDVTGSVDLAYRQLALHMLAYPKQRALAQLPLPLTIDGSFDKPHIHADKKILLQHFEQLGATLSGKKPAIEKALASELGQRMRASGVDASCLRDLPSDAMPATKEDFKALEDDVKQEIKDIGTHHKEDFKRIEDDVRGIRDALQGLRGKE
ncbi:MAG: AsmA family protein [Alphaproteobacteria bacterium]|nr:MAG: AsmA family protein [Alphaproteobacteria bacterium]